MRMETKYLRLRAPVELGSRFDEWQVCWLGGWAKHRLYYLVMLVKVPFEVSFADRLSPTRTFRLSNLNKEKRRRGSGGAKGAGSARLQASIE